MKPNWSQAPYWAEYLAQDRDGVWHWYEDQPQKESACGEWLVHDVMRYEVASKPRAPKWEQSLERRPWTP